MRFCLTLLAAIGLAVWSVGCGSGDEPVVDDRPVLGEAGSETPGMLTTDAGSGAEDTGADDAATDDPGAEETESEDGPTVGPELP